MLDEGHIKLYRQLLHSPLWTRERFTYGQAWVDMLLLANYHDSTVLRGGKRVAVLRGQLFTSQVSLAKRWRWDRETVVRYLMALKQDNTIDLHAHKGNNTGYTIITILNYNQYQGAPNGDAPLSAPPDPPLGPASVPHIQEVKTKSITVFMRHPTSPTETENPTYEADDATRQRIVAEAGALKRQFAVAHARAES